jgi:hypothetical protein
MRTKIELGVSVNPVAGSSVLMKKREEKSNSPEMESADASSVSESDPEIRNPKTKVLSPYGGQNHREKNQRYPQIFIHFIIMDVLFQEILW